MKKILFAFLILAFITACNSTTNTETPKPDSTTSTTGPLPIPTSVTGTFSGQIPCDCPGINLSLTLAPDSMFTAVINYKGLRTKGKSLQVIRGSVTQDSGLITLKNDSLPTSSFKIISTDSLAVLTKIKPDEKQYLVRGKRL